MKLLLTTAFYLLLLSSMANGQVSSQPYEFPIRPGTAEWEKLSNFVERRNAYNIPDRLLHSMSTEHLVQTCLNYPDFTLMMTRNSLQQGYDYLKTLFNGFAELEQRKNAAAELLNAYQQLEPASINSYATLEERGRYSFRFIFTEIMLAQEPILKSMDGATEIELIKQSLAHYDAKSLIPEQYASFSLMTPAFVLGRILKVRSDDIFNNVLYTRKDILYFVEFSTIYSTETIPSIISQAKLHLKRIDNE